MRERFGVGEAATTFRYVESHQGKQFHSKNVCLR